MPILAGGAAMAAAGIGVGLWRLHEDRLPQAAMLSSAFFIISLIHVPIGTGSVHLMLSGLLGLVLGWSAFPAIAVALGLQAVLFGHGGITTLGVNTLIMALPAVGVYLLLGRAVALSRRRWLTATLGFVAGAAAIAGSTALFALALYWSHPDLQAALLVFSAAHGVLMLAEGAITASAVVFLKHVRPQMLA